MTLADALADPGLRVVDLGRSLQAGVPCSPTHPGFSTDLQARHTDPDRSVRPDGLTGSHESIHLGAHVGTHVDAPCHVALDGRILGVDVADALVDGRYAVGGIEAFVPYVGRAVLLDVPRLLGRSMRPGEAVTREHLHALVRDAPPRAGEAVLVRTGWGGLWPQPRYAEMADGQPGLDVDAARALLEHDVALVGADTLAVEHLTAERGLTDLPVHRLLLAEHGVHLVENLDLETLAGLGATEVSLVCAPLAIVGATGAPVRPLALVEPRRTP